MKTKTFNDFLKVKSLQEAEDHEVGMAQGQLAALIKAATELQVKLGATEKNVPGWIQGHITSAYEYLKQANDNFHELEEKFIAEGGKLASTEWVEMVGPDLNSMAKAVYYINSEGLVEVERILGTEMPYLLTHQPQGRPGGKGQYLLTIDFVQKFESKITVDQAIDAVNKVIDESGIGNKTIKILK
jgi:hypothetical protein